MGLAARVKERLWAGAETDYRTKILDTLAADPSAVLLDVGCEDGVWTDRLRQRLGIPPASVHGLEVVRELADRARSRGFDVRLADVDEPWPFEDASMDVVHANQVIEHVKRLDHFAQEVKRVLAPGGMAIVCTENLASWHNVGALALGFQPFSLTNISGMRPIGNPLAVDAHYLAAGESFQHIHVMTLTALRDLFKAHGFAIGESWGRGYHPLPRSLARLLASLDPRHAHFIGVVVRVT